MSFFDKVFDIIAWIKIFLSPFIVGLITGLILWRCDDGLIFKILSVVVILGGIAGGIYFAERVRKKMGTQLFLSQISATPELDKKPEEPEEKK